MDMGCMQPSLPCAIKHHFGTGLLETVQTVTAYFCPQFFSKAVAVGKI